MEPTGKELTLTILPNLKVLNCLACLTWVTLATQNKTLYKCWIPFIEFHTLMSYRTVGMLHDTWHCQQGIRSYGSLYGQIQTHLTWTTRKIHIHQQDHMESLCHFATLQDSLTLAFGGFVPLLHLWTSCATSSCTLIGALRPPALTYWWMINRCHTLWLIYSAPPLNGLW